MIKIVLVVLHDKDSIGRQNDRDNIGCHNKDNKFREMLKNEIC
jgi:hypothetical protein